MTDGPWTHRKPISDQERAILSRLVRQMRSSSPSATHQAGIQELTQLLQQFWWLMNHADTVGTVAERSDVDRLTVAEVLSAAQRYMVERVGEVADSIDSADVPTTSYRRRPSSA